VDDAGTLKCESFSPVFNQAKGLNGWPIHCILTDGAIFQFFKCSFKDYSIHRGVATAVEEGVAIVPDYKIALSREHDVQYLGQLKIIVEVFLDMFLETLINGVQAEREYSERRARQQIGKLGAGYLRRASTSTWLETELIARQALDMLRKAHHQRVIDVAIAEQMANDGIELIRRSALNIPREDLSLLGDWEDKKHGLMLL
jgi:hypothetical protein